MSNKSEIEANRIFILNLYTLADKLVYYSTFSVATIGIASNILNIIISSRANLRKKAMGFYNIIISIFNILIIVVGSIQYFPTSIGAVNFFLISNFWCVLMTSSSRILIHMVSWLNVMVSLDRTLCVSLSNRLKFIQIRKNMLMFMLAMFAVVCALNSPNFFFKLEYDVSFNYTSNKTVSINVRCAATKLITNIRDTIAQLIRTVIPIILQIILNTILIYKLIQTKKQVNISRSLQKEYKFAFTIIMLNFLFIITQAPLLIFTIYINFIAQQSNIDSKQMAINNFASIVSTLFSTYLFFSLFFVNLIFNKLFQREIGLMFGMNKKRKQRQK